MGKKWDLCGNPRAMRKAKWAVCSDVCNPNYGDGGRLRLQGEFRHSSFGYSGRFLGVVLSCYGSVEVVGAF